MLATVVALNNAAGLRSPALLTKEEAKPMLRATASKVMWVGRATVFFVGLAVILALIFGVISRATAHTGSAGLFHLNHNNPVTALSTLTGTLAGAVIKVDNNGTGPALSLEVGSGKAPLMVNSTAGKATNLNADKLDGKDSSELEPRGYAQINHTGPTLVSGSSKGVIDVVRTASDVYCFDLSFTPRAAVASAHLNNNATVGTLISPASGCSAPHTDAAAKVYGANDSSVHSDVSFGIVFM
jgi:hypothetical protein